MILLDVLKYDIINYLQVNELLSIRHVCKYLENIIYVSQFKITKLPDCDYLDKISTNIPIEYINTLQIKFNKHIIKNFCINYNYQYTDYYDHFINISHSKFLILNFTLALITVSNDICVNIITRFPINKNEISIT